MPKIKQFPDTVYISVESDHEDNFMLAHASPEDAVDQESPIRLGVYKFVETVEAKTGGVQVKKLNTRQTYGGKTK